VSNNSGYLILGVDGLIISALGVYYQREAIMSSLSSRIEEPKPVENFAPPPTKTLKRSTIRQIDLKCFTLYVTMSDNKLVKTVLDAATLTGLSAGIRSIAKKIVKDNFTSDHSSNVMNYVKFIFVMAGSIALKQYLEDQKILPKTV